jgi:hypothetical protein
MEYKYLVANPWGVFLVRCKSLENVEIFVNQHLEKCQDAYYLLLKHYPIMSDYLVRDITEVPEFKAWH